MYSSKLFSKDSRLISLELTNSCNALDAKCQGKKCTLNIDIENTINNKLDLNHSKDKVKIILNAQSRNKKSKVEGQPNTENASRLTSTPGTETGRNCELHKKTYRLLKTDYEKLYELGKFLQIATTSISHVSVDSSRIAGKDARECKSLPNLSALTCRISDNCCMMNRMWDQSNDSALRSLNLVKNELQILSCQIVNRINRSSTSLQQCTSYETHSDSKYVLQSKPISRKDETNTIFQASEDPISLKMCLNNNKNNDSNNNFQLINVSSELLQHSGSNSRTILEQSNIENTDTRGLCKCASDSVTSQNHDVTQSQSKDGSKIPSISQPPSCADAQLRCLTRSNNNKCLQSKTSRYYIQIVTSNSIVNLNYNKINSTTINISHRSINNIPNYAESPTEGVVLDLYKDGDVVPIYEENNFNTLSVRLQLPHNQCAVAINNKCIFSFIHRLPMTVSVKQETASTVRITSELEGNSTESGQMLLEVGMGPGGTTVTVPLRRMCCEHRCSGVKHVLRARSIKRQAVISSRRCMSDSSVRRTSSQASQPSQRRRRCRSTDVSTGKKKKRNNPWHMHQSLGSCRGRQVEQFINVDIFTVRGDPE